MKISAPPSLELRAPTKTITFTGAAGAGAIGQVVVYTVTGQVLIKQIIARCTTDLVGATATVSLGRAGSVAALIAATLATTIDAGQFWMDGTPLAGLKVVPTGLQNVLTNLNITMDVLIAAITAGVLVFDAIYVPLTADGALS